MQRPRYTRSKEHKCTILLGIQTKYKQSTYIACGACMSVFFVGLVFVCLFMWGLALRAGGLFVCFVLICWFFVCLFIYLRIGSEGWWLVWRAAAACLPLIIVNQRTGSWDGQNLREKKDRWKILISDLEIFFITVLALESKFSHSFSKTQIFQMVIGLVWKFQVKHFPNLILQIYTSS